MTSIRRLGVVTTIAAYASAGAAGLFNAQVCEVPGERWTLDASGQLISVGSGLCATVSNATAGSTVSLAACTGSTFQRFDYVNQTLYLQGAPTQCLSLPDISQWPSTVVTVNNCSLQTGFCQGNCNWTTFPSDQGFTNVTLQIGPMVFLNYLCLQDGSAFPTLPHTCESGSPAYSLPFCDYTLPVEQRVADVLSRLDLNTKVSLFAMPGGRFFYNDDLNLKSVLWDTTCIHGFSPNQMIPNRNSTTFPHAIGLAASFDLPLYTRIGQAMALEARIINQINYEATYGTVWQAVSCDGGPLANTAHDPRWGRISETYGEDPFLSASMGATATQVMQNRSADGQWLQLSLVTRHYLGYHESNDLDNGGEEFIDLFSFTDQQELPYRTFQNEGGAEGIMCAIAAFSIGQRSTWNSTLAPMIPSCVHPFLWAKLRDDWGSDSFVQTDCCGSIWEMVFSHHYYPDIATATLNSIEMGLQATYGSTLVDWAMRDMLANGTLDMGLLDQRLARMLLTRFRLGEFDIGRNPHYPYAGPYDVSKLDGPANRALAREAMAASTVLLENKGLLPMALGPGKTLAVIGPFADCSNLAGGYGGIDNDVPVVCSYLHSYSGYASQVSTILNAAREEAQAAGFTVTYAQGSNIVSPLNGTNGLSQAVAVAGAADVVLLVVGLGSILEKESVDRLTLQLPDPQQALVDAVRGVAANKTVLVVVSAGTVDTNYTLFGAAVQAWYGGEETGHGLMDVLTGRVNPSARLPLTVYKEHYLDLIEPLAVFTMITEQGTGRTYRYFQDTPGPSSLVHYWFGYGLSYTKFSYSGLTVSQVSPAPGQGSPDTARYVTVTVTMTNTGSVPGAEVAQVYVTVPNTTAVYNMTFGAPVPKYGLVGYTKTAVLASGTGVQLSWTLPVRGFQTTSNNGERLVTGGQYTVSVSGHLPDDANGLAESNVVSAQLQLQPLTA